MHEEPMRSRPLLTGTTGAAPPGLPAGSAARGEPGVASGSSVPGDDPFPERRGGCPRLDPEGKGGK